MRVVVLASPSDRAMPPKFLSPLACRIRGVEPEAHVALAHTEQTLALLKEHELRARRARVHLFPESPLPPKESTHVSQLRKSF